MKSSVVTKAIVASALLVGVLVLTVEAFSDSENTVNHMSNIETMGGSQVSDHGRLLNSAMNQVHFAQLNISRMQQQGDQQMLRVANGVLRDAEFLLVSIMSQTSGVPSASIINMHMSGLAWAEIPSRLGMNTSLEVSGSVVVVDNDLHTEIMNQIMDEMHGDNRYDYPSQNRDHMNYGAGNGYSGFRNHGSMH